MRTVGAVSVQSFINSSRSERRKSDSQRRWLCRLFISVFILLVLCYDIVLRYIFVPQASVSGGCVSDSEIILVSPIVYVRCIS